MTETDRGRFMDWLKSGTPLQKRHAAARLGIAPPRVVPRPEVRRMIAVLRWGLRGCLYSSTEGCGCQGAYCHYKREIVNVSDCLKCLPMPKGVE